MRKKIVTIVAVIVFCIGLFSLTSVVESKYSEKLKASAVIDKKENNKIKEKLPVVEATTNEEKLEEKPSSPKSSTPEEKPSVSSGTTSTPEKNKESQSQTTQPIKTQQPRPVEPAPKEEVNFIIEDAVHNKTIISLHGDFSGESVGSITKKTLESKGIKYRATGNSSSLYFSSINGIKERDAGPTSGWCYFVNGVKLNKGCGQYTPQNGDIVVWKYLENGISE